MEAKKWKDTANNLFKNGKYTESIDLYTKAINSHPKAIYYTNRSSAYLKLEQFAYALDDATQAVKMDKMYAKGYTKLGDAHMGLQKFSLALENYERARNIDPSNITMASKIKKCKVRLEKGEF